MIEIPEELADNILGHLYELRAEWYWKRYEPQDGNAAEYEALEKVIERLEGKMRGKAPYTMTAAGDWRPPGIIPVCPATNAHP